MAWIDDGPIHDPPLDNILRIHHLHPASGVAHEAFYETLMHGTSSLPPRENEMIAVLVSSLNECEY